MSPSDAFIAFYTLLLGLGMAALLTGFAGVVRRHRTLEIGATGLLLSVLIIFEFLTGWSGATRTFSGSDSNVLTLLLPFGTGACYFLASVLIFPEPGESDQDGGVGAYIASQVRTIAILLFAANLLLIGAELPFVSAKMPSDPSYFWAFYLPYNGAILFCYAVMIAAPKRGIAVGAMLGLVMIYAWVTGTSTI